VPYKKISNSTLGKLGRLGKVDGGEGEIPNSSSSSESFDNGGTSKGVCSEQKSSGDRISSSLKPDKGSGNDSLKSRARPGGWFAVPLALIELARDVLSVLTMLWLRASSTRRSSAELLSALVKDDRPNGDEQRENSVGSSSASSSVLSTNPSQISRSPRRSLSRELGRLLKLKVRRDKGRPSASSRSLSGYSTVVEFE
jgi:hypothetical protein